MTRSELTNQRTSRASSIGGHPTFALLDAILAGSDIFPDDLTYRRGGILKIGLYRIAQASATGYAQHKGLRPGDDYDRRGPAWEAILGPHGWEPVRSDGSVTYWRRPGKDGRCWSATTGYCRGKEGADLLHVVLVGLEVVPVLAHGTAGPPALQPPAAILSWARCRPSRA